MLNPNLDSPYLTFDLTDEEYVRASLLTPEQRARIQNHRMEVIEHKLQLTASDLTESGKQSYWQQEAYLRGQLDILTHLLDASSAAHAASLELPFDEGI